MTAQIVSEGDTFEVDTTNYTIESSWDNSTSYSSDTHSISFTNGSTIQHNGSSSSSIQGQQCNESLKHSHDQKAIFHGMKSAFRIVSRSEKGVKNPQVMEALRVAGSVARAYLQSENIEYNSEKSEEYLEKNFLDKFRPQESIIESAIEKAWNKIDNGDHKGGARIAVSVADEYLDEYSLPEVRQ